MVEATELFTEGCIHLGSKSTDLQSLLGQIASLAKTSPNLTDLTEEDIYKALMEREKLAPTAIGHGIAIPHCRLDQATDFTVGLVTIPDGIAFKGSDKIGIAFFIIAPTGRDDEHVRILSHLSRLVHKQETRDLLQRCQTEAEVLSLFGGSSAPVVTSQGDKNCVFQLMIQREELFNDIIQEISSICDAVMIMDAKSPRDYLQRLPVFATFWNMDTSDDYQQVVTGTVRKALVNELIRTVDTITGGLDSCEGIQIAVYEASFCLGKLNL